MATSTTDNLGECRMIILEPFNNGNNAILMMKLKRPIEINGHLKTNVGIILEEAQLREMIDGLERLASMQEAARSIGRVIRSA